MSNQEIFSKKHSWETIMSFIFLRNSKVCRPVLWYHFVSVKIGYKVSILFDRIWIYLNRNLKTKKVLFLIKGPFHKSI